MTTSFCAYIWDWKNEKELDLIELSQQLPQNEKKHLEDLRSSKRRLEYLTGRILLRTILQKIFDLPCNIEIKKSKKGKPFIESGPEFNLSHSRGITFLGVSNDAPIGVDVEFQTEGRDVSGIAKYYGRSDELQYLESLGHKEQNEAFYKIWSLKESYSKAKGIGIDHSLQNIFFDLKNNKVFESVKSLTATNSRSGEFKIIFAAARPILPKPFIAIFVIISSGNKILISNFEILDNFK